MLNKRQLLFFAFSYIFCVKDVFVSNYNIHYSGPHVQKNINTSTKYMLFLMLAKEVK